MAVSSALQVDPTTLLCISENMFVHNNSKHGRKIRRIDGTEELAGLYPHTLVPQVPISSQLIAIYDIVDICTLLVLPSLMLHFA